MHRLFTSESVTAGHPDKVADQISDAILDELIGQDPRSRVAVEVLLTVGTAFVAGEITTSGYADILGITRAVIRDIGYTKPEYGFNWSDLGALTAIHEQSPEIAQKLDPHKVGKGGKIVKEDLSKLGAGDQGCIKKGSLVRTKRGFVPIEDVRAGDDVATPQGWRTVLHSTKTGVKNVVDVEFFNGASLACTPDHKILCYRRDGTTFWKSAKDLQVGEFVCMLKPQENLSQQFIESTEPKSQFFSKYNHKIFGPEQVTLNEGIGYLAGELMGDGHLGKHNSIHLAFGTNQEHAVAVREIASRQMPGQWRLVGQGSDLALKIDSVLVRKHLDNFGLGYATAAFKETPQAVLVSPKRVVVNYLRGLFDSDGTIISNTGRNRNNVKIRLGSSALMLLRETQLSLHDLGIKSSIVHNRPVGIPVGRKGSNGKVYRSRYSSYILGLVGYESYQRFGQLIGFRDRRKQSRLLAYLDQSQHKVANSRGMYLIPHPTKDEFIDERRLGRELPFTVAVCREVKNLGELAEVYDLEIEDVNMFSANGIFVHNSMFGYACTETKELMPLPITLAHRLAQRLEEVRRKDIIKGLRPDGKTQATILYEDDQPVSVVNIVVAAQHDPKKSLKTLKGEVIRAVIRPVLAEFPINAKRAQFFVNVTGSFVLGGPQADTGLTGRKNIVDTYGGSARHGGGALSGKDPTKVDRSGQYAARWVAKNIVAAGLAARCEFQLGYVIGQPKPVSVAVETFGTGTVSDKAIAKAVGTVFDLRPGIIIQELKLRRPIYRQTASYGHFGRPDLDLPWEKTNKVTALKRAIK